MRIKERAAIPAPRTSPENPPEQAAPRHRWRRPAAAAALVLLLLAGTGLFVRSAQLAGEPALDNAALTDTEATDRVIGDVSNALGKVFSYQPDNMDATAQDAEELLTGRAAGQYEKLYGQVRQRAAEQELTLVTHVVRAGVNHLTDDSAQLLVFLDQVTDRKGEEETTAAAQLSVTAEFTDGTWRISELKAR